MQMTDVFLFFLSSSIRRTAALSSSSSRHRLHRRRLQQLIYTFDSFELKRSAFEMMIHNITHTHIYTCIYHNTRLYISLGWNLISVYLRCTIYYCCSLHRSHHRHLYRFVLQSMELELNSLLQINLN